MTREETPESHSNHSCRSIEKVYNNQQNDCNRHEPPRFLEMANFVLDTGTTSFAQTNPAAMHSKITDPMPMKSDRSGATASNVCDGALLTEFENDESATVNVFEVTKSGKKLLFADSDWWEEDSIDEK